MTERRDITFFGRVQGVGFRYTAIRVAGGYDVTGYVRNVPDGSVQCVVEGEAADIDLFVEDLSSRMGRYIERVTQSKSQATGQFSSFDVEF